MGYNLFIEGMEAAARMCGIVGILGRSPVAVQLVDALKRLEYRGYDSAGVATLEKGRLTRRRAGTYFAKAGQAPIGPALEP